jgi:ubiquinol-cytochrome c reductase cytochrome c1 subunit
MKLLLKFVLLAFFSGRVAAGGAVHLDEANVDVSDQESLQRGARLFVNYCLSCHSAKFQRYNRMARDLGLSEEEVKQNLMFTTDKIGETMNIAMPSEQSEKWFGTAPPDLSVITRARGVDWVYTYLRSFYLDEKRPFGVNNLVFKDVGMPHIFWKQQGVQKAVFKTEKDADGNEHEVFDKFELVEAGTMSPDEFDGAMRDLTAFMSYVGEPVQVERRRLGVWVLLFLAFFFVISYLLKKEYWKDVH